LEWPLLTSVDSLKPIKELVLRFYFNCNILVMKTVKTTIAIFAVAFAFSSCGFLGIGKTKTGCTSDGRNVGAERILAGDKTVPKKQPKFKG
jgi:hypothetical protein